MDTQSETYKLKKIEFKGKKIPIVLQNTNGPCPLLAVANILLMRGHITIHEDLAFVGADELLGRIGEYLLDSKVEVSDSLRANHERNVSDVIQMLPKTQRGIDVNVQFKGITAFEFTSESMLFDFCNTRLVHGWLVDPQDSEMSFLRNMSYNQLVEKQIQFQQQTEDLAKKMSALKVEKESSEVESVENVPPVDTNTKEDESASKIIKEGLLAEKFFNDSASQLTYHGLSELHSGIKEEELCVFFRNNHFSTLYKHNGELYLLVTDQGYAKEPLVWEKLNQIDGDSVFLKSDYSRYEAMSPGLAMALSSMSESEAFGGDEDRIAQSDRDMALALQMQQEEDAKNEKNTGGDKPIKSGDNAVEGENRRHSGEKKKHKSDCMLQ